MRTEYRVAICGAGVSGLAAAVRLALTKADRPLHITIYESRRDAGGRTRSFVEQHTGDTIDNGQHLLMGCYTSTLKYLDMIGAIGNIERCDLDIPYFIKDGSAPNRLHITSSLPSPLGGLIGLLSTDLLALFEKSAAIRLGITILNKKYDSWSKDRSCAELFSKTHQPETLIAKLWEPIILATMNTSVRAASASVFIEIIRTIFFKHRTYSELVIPKVGLSELLVEPAIGLLRSMGHNIILGEPIEEIIDGSDRVTIKTESGHSAEFDAVIVAASPVPSFLSQWIDVPKDLQFSPIVNVFFWIDRKVLDAPVNSFIGTTLQWAFPKPSKYAKQMIATTISAASPLVDQDNQAIISLIESELRAALRSEFQVLHAIVIKEKRATYRLGPDVESSRPAVRSRSKNVFIASDLASNSLPFTIEGSIRNGFAASGALLHDKLFMHNMETEM